MVFPSIRGMPTNTGSGNSSNLTGAATDKTSFVFLTIARVMYLKETAGPYSVPPMLSITNFDTDFT
jgi:hypothetical protein